MTIWVDLGHSWLNLSALSVLIQVGSRFTQTSKTVGKTAGPASVDLLADHLRGYLFENPAEQITCSLNLIYAAIAHTKFPGLFSSCSHALFLRSMRLVWCRVRNRYVIKVPRLFSILWLRDLFFVFLFPSIHSLHTFCFWPFSLFLLFFWHLEMCDKDSSVITHPCLSAGMLPHSSTALCTRAQLLFFHLLLFGISPLLHGFLRNLAEN